MTTYTVSSGQTSSGIILNSGDTETVLSGGSATFTTINSGGMLDVYTGGVASGTMVSSFGREMVYSGGVASGTVVSIFGSEQVFSGGVAVGTVLSSGGAQGIFTGGVASGTVVGSGGEEIVSSGGVTSGTMVGSGGEELVSSGGFAVGTVVGSGYEFVLSGGVSVGTVVSSGGAETVGGVASGTVVSSGGAEYVEGGVASGTVVSSGGLENVGYGGLSGGVTSGTVVSNGGEEIVSSGAVASGTVVSNGGSLTVSAGGSATSTAIDSGGSLILSAGGSAGITVIGSGGSLTGLPGGIAIAGSGAMLDLLSGAIVSGGITFGGSGGQLQIDGTMMPSATISGFVSGDTIDLPGIAFDSGGSVNLVSSGGVQNQLQITEGGKTYDLNLDPSQSFAGDLFHIASDGTGGTLVTENQFVVVSGSPGGLTFKIGFDQPDSGTGALPAGFKSAVISSFQYYANTFNDPGVTLYFNIGYGEVGGSALDKGALGESITTFQSQTYAALRSAMVADAATAADDAAIANDLPAADPTGGQTLEIAVAEEQALGLISGSPTSGAGFAFSNPDGDIGFSSSLAFDYTPGQVPTSGTYDFIGTAEHEISEVMGRTSYLDQAGKYSPMDLFRYAGPGTRQLTANGNPSYFSLDGGATDLYNWNNNTVGSGGDLGDWATTSPYTPDSYNAFSDAGVLNPVTSRDTTLMDVLGWNRASATTYTVGAGQTSNGVIIYSGDKELVQSGGTAIATYALSGGLEVVSAGASDSGATMSSGAEQDVFGRAATVVVNGGLQVVESGGTAVSTVISGSGAVMDLLSGAIVSGGITFSGSGAQLQIVGTPPTSPISGFTAISDTIDLTRLAFSGNDSVGFNSATDMLTVTEGGASAAIQLDSESYTGISWAAQSDGVSGTEVKVACFGRGTRILTEAGEVPVEDLAIGDRVMSISGEARPIRWIGRRSYAARFVAGNRAVRPIRVAAGALADGLPTRELSVSPEHALYFDGVLVPASQLVNGATVVQAEAVEQVDYFHIELDTHDIIFAEGMPAESYVDCDNRLMFHNAAEFAALYPDDRRAAWEFCVPRLDAGSAELAAIRVALLQRAEALGYALDHNPNLHLVVDGEIVPPDSVVGCVYCFDIPAGSAAVWLASRSTVPAETTAAARDLRRLGVPIDRIVLSDGDLRIEAWHGHAMLCEGFHEDEGSHRWTDGLGRLPASWLRSFPSAFTLQVQLVPSGLGYRIPPPGAALMSLSMTSLAQPTDLRSPKMVGSSSLTVG